jgi:amidase
MSSSLEGVNLFMQTVLAARPWLLEPALVPLPWTPVDIAPTATKPLRIGVMWHDEVVLPHPPITRALREFVGRLRELGHVEVVGFPAYKHDEAWAIASSLYFTDGGKADADAIAASGEPWCPLTRWMIQENPCVKRLSREKLEYWLEEREQYRIEYVSEWNKSGRWDEETGRWENTVDVVISPVAPGVATRHGTAKYWSYTAVWNLLDYPALAFPVGKVDRTADVAATRKSFMSEIDEEVWQLCT